MDLEQAAARAANAIRSRPRGARWFLACDNDADGICAAAVMARALQRAGCGFQLRASRQKDAAFYRDLAHASCDGYLVLDKGSSHLEDLADVARRTDRPVIVIDHHGLPETIPPEPVVVNPRGLGLDGSRDASASTTAAAVAIALDPANLDMAGVALAGAVGDWQHRGGWRGWNQRLIEQAMDAGHLQRRPQPVFIGVDLADALVHARVPGLDDRAAAVAFLEPLGLSDAPDAEGLDAEAQARLVSAVVLQHLARGEKVEPASLLRDALWLPRLDVGVRHLFRLVDACARRGNAAAASAFLLGDATQRDAVEHAFRGYVLTLRHAIQRLAAEGTATRTSIQVAWTDEPGMTGMVGGIGMTHVLPDQHRPIVVLAERPDGEVQVSTRGTHEAVERGLDLGGAVAQAARRIGRDGGGHPIAAGAVVAPADVEAFLEALDTILTQQAFLPDTL